MLGVGLFAWGDLAESIRGLGDGEVLLGCVYGVPYYSYWCYNGSYPTHVVLFTGSLVGLYNPLTPLRQSEKTLALGFRSS